MSSNFDTTIPVVDAIETVSKTVMDEENARSVSKTASKSQKFEEVVSSIETVSLAAEKIPETTVLDITSNVTSEFIPEILNSIHKVSYKVFKKYETFLTEKKGDDFSILRKLRRTSDENLHSDFIASLLQESFAREFLTKLLKTAGFNVKSNIREIKTVQRECRLDSVNSSLTNFGIGGRRIDIFVIFDEYVLLLENKVGTYESKNQTTDYYKYTSEGLEGGFKVFGILLSPEATSAQSENFKSLSYLDLYKIIREISLNHDDRLLKLYESELEQTIIKRDVENAKNSKKYFERIALNEY